MLKVHFPKTSLSTNLNSRASPQAAMANFDCFERRFCFFKMQFPQPPIAAL